LTQGRISGRPGRRRLRFKRKKKRKDDAESRLICHARITVYKIIIAGDGVNIFLKKFKSLKNIKSLYFSYVFEQS
jgi:hypothetical protein